MPGGAPSISWADASEVNDHSVMPTKVALDTNIAAYLIDAIEIGYSPFEDFRTGLAPERIAAYRIYVYAGTPFVVPTVRNEIEQTRDPDRHWKPLNTVAYQFNEIGEQDLSPQCVAERAEAYRAYHRGPHNERDCRIVAEAECAGLDVLLTFDVNLKKALVDRTSSLAIKSPSEYWQELGLPRGLEPKHAPAQGNVLALAKWWRW